MSEWMRCVGAFLFAFILNLTLEKLWIHYQKRRKEGQVIREELTQHHQKKGTPTMGGLPLLLSAMVSYFSFFQGASQETLSFLFLIGGYFLLGLIDDILKEKGKKKKGLSPFVRLLCEILLFAFFLRFLPGDLSIRMSLVPVAIPFGFLPFLFLLFCHVGGANAVNLTDGLDGLLGGLLLIAFFPFVLIALTSGHPQIAGILLSLIGALLAFLVYNTHPATIFLGDCGSLSLGVAFVSVSYLLGVMELLPWIGIVFVVETVSVIAQVISFQLFHRRIFLMAPLHHHFERKGVKEVRITLFYYLFAYAFALVAVLAYYL